MCRNGVSPVDAPERGRRHDPGAAAIGGLRHRRSNRRAAALVAGALLVSAGHFAVSAVTHPQHVVHVALRGIDLLLIVAAALWYGRKGAATGSIAFSAVALANLLVNRPGQEMERLIELAFIGVYLLVGAVTGALVERERVERDRRLASERRAERETVIQALAGLSGALGARDEYTERHSEQVSTLAVEMGRDLGLSGDRLDILRLASLVHDVGKIGVPDDILFKAEELTRQERARIERHPRIAAEILAPIRGTREIAEIVLCHHECPDGTGYPRGLRGEEIPVEARLLRVADVFSALSDRRSYKPACDEEIALLRMKPLRGTKIDGESFDTLVRVLARSPGPNPNECRQSAGEGAEAATGGNRGSS